MMMRRQTPAPTSDGSPYIPVITYTIAWPTVITMPNTGNKEDSKFDTYFLRHINT